MGEAWRRINLPCHQYASISIRKEGTLVGERFRISYATLPALCRRMTDGRFAVFKFSSQSDTKFSVVRRPELVSRRQRISIIKWRLRQICAINSLPRDPHCNAAFNLYADALSEKYAFNAISLRYAAAATTRMKHHSLNIRLVQGIEAARDKLFAATYEIYSLALLQYFSM